MPQLTRAAVIVRIHDSVRVAAQIGRPHLYADGVFDAVKGTAVETTDVNGRKIATKLLCSLANETSKADFLLDHDIVPLLASLLQKTGEPLAASRDALAC